MYFIPNFRRNGSILFAHNDVEAQPLLEGQSKQAEKTTLQRITLVKTDVRSVLKESPILFCLLLFLIVCQSPGASIAAWTKGELFSGNAKGYRLAFWAWVHCAVNLLLVHIFARLIANLSLTLQKSLAAKITSRASLHSLALSTSFHTRVSPSDIHHRITCGSLAISKIYLICPEVISSGLQVTLATLLVWREVSGIAIGILYVLALSSLGWRKLLRIQQYSEAMVEDNRRSFSQLGSFLENWQLIKGFAAELRVGREIDALITANCRIRTVHMHRGDWLSIAQKGHKTLVLPVCITIMAVMGFTLSLREVAILSSSISSLATPLESMQTLLNEFPDQFRAYEQLEEVLLATSVYTKTQDLPRLQAHRGDVIVSNVRRRIGPLDLQADFKASRGSKTGIVGRTGAGKTTLLKILHGEEGFEGDVRVDGQSIHETNLRSFRERVGLMLSKSDFLGSSIFNNFQLSRGGTTEAEMYDACKRTCIYDTILDCGGFFTDSTIKRLSDGQRQLLSLARTFNQAPQVMLLDEPTASLDNKSRNDALDALESFTHDRTLIVVTHQPKFLRHFDQILVLSKGRVVQKGSFEELRACDGLFKELVNVEDN